jgi:hypothetical protein
MLDGVSFSTEGAVYNLKLKKILDTISYVRSAKMTNFLLFFILVHPFSNVQYQSRN